MIRKITSAYSLSWTSLNYRSRSHSWDHFVIYSTIRWDAIRQSFSWASNKQSSRGQIDDNKIEV